MKAMILAAGHGRRLNDLTKNLPKPLMPLAENFCLIDFAVCRLAALGITQFAVNLHYLGDKIEKYLRQNYPQYNFHFCYEKELLGTGGGIANARDFLLKDNDDVIVVNADIMHFFDLSQALKTHHHSHCSASMIIMPASDKARAVRYHPQNGLTGFFDNEGDLLLGDKGNQHNDDLWGTFTGIQILSAQFISSLPAGTFSIINIYANMVKSSQKVNIISIDKDFWLDMGTPLRLERGKHLFSIIKKNNFSCEHLLISKLYSGASAKSVWRLKDKTKTAILLLQVDTNEIEHTSRLHNFLADTGFSTPKLIDKKDNWLLMHDAGNHSLLDIVRQKGLSDRTVKSLYMEALHQLKVMAQMNAEQFADDNCSNARVYAQKGIYYDLQLFNKYCLNNEVPPQQLESLSDYLYHILSQYPLAVMHRDFQSTNLMVNDNNKLSVIDLQTMRCGYSIYDAAALIFDSYIPFNEEFLVEMIDKFYELLSFQSHPKNDIFWIAFLRVSHDLGVFYKLAPQSRFFANCIAPAVSRLKYIISKIDLDEQLLELLDRYRMV